MRWLTKSLAYRRELPWLKEVYEQGASLTVSVCRAAAAGGQVKVLQWLRTEGCPWDEHVLVAAAANNQPECLAFGLKEGGKGRKVRKGGKRHIAKKLACPFRGHEHGSYSALIY